MIRILRISALFALCSALGLPVSAQTWATIATENDTVVIGATPATLQFGAIAGTPITVAGSTPCTTVGGCFIAPPLTITSGPPVTITANAAAFGGADPAVGTLKLVQAEETNVSQTFTVTNNGTVAETQQGVSIAPGATAAVTVPALPVAAPPAAPIVATDCTGQLFEVGGGTAGMTATVPAGTIYQLGTGPCTTAAAATPLDLSGGNLNIQYTLAVQAIAVSNNGTAYSISIPALIPISISNIQFDTVDANGNQMHCAYLAPGILSYACRMLTPSTSP